jgi:hypothetical protein
MARMITESQYMKLRGYRDGRDRWVNGGPSDTLVQRGFLVAAPHDPVMFRITASGIDALHDFEKRHGIGVAAMREP